MLVPGARANRAPEVRRAVGRGEGERYARQSALRLVEYAHDRFRSLWEARVFPGQWLEWPDLDRTHRLIAVRAKLKGGKVRYVPMPDELAEEFRRQPRELGEKRIFPPKPGARSGRQRVDRSFKTVLKKARIEDFRFHDLRHTFASWFMMNGGDLYELAKILGHSNIKVTERYAKLAKSHIARTGTTARQMWRMMEGDGRGDETAAV